jgi:hypothetical protein
MDSVQLRVLTIRQRSFSVEDALSSFGVTITEYPVTPARLFALIAAARS